jgi:glutamine synthetase
MKKKINVEYIWLDGYEEPNLRGKTKIIDYEEGNWYSDWSFDGTSTKQAGEGFDFEGTDCVLKVKYTCKDPFKEDGVLAFCDVYNPDGETPHISNKRHHLATLLEDLNLSNGNTFIQYPINKVNDRYNKLPWFGWEQEYTLTNKLRPFGDGEGVPLGFGMTEETQPRPQGEYYCGVGSDNVTGRRIADEHAQKCIEAGLGISGVNAEVMLGQWEYQIGPVTGLEGSDQLWISRYILRRVAEKNGVKVSFHPKPMKGDWNGSGCHVNFSTEEMREEGGLSLIYEACEKLSNKHKEHIEVYGLKNEERMTGEHETSSIHDFSYGDATRDTSIRIPIGTINKGKGYFEDRRPSSNCDPYEVSRIMLDTVLSTQLTEKV